MNRFILAAALLLAAASPAARAAAASAADPDTLVVRGERIAGGDELRRLDPARDLAADLARSPFALIRKGGAGCIDLYADGFKRDDLAVTVDGERYTTACPNRMDTRAGHLNPLSVGTATLSRGAAGLQAGLGGGLAFHRRPPGEATRTAARLVGAFDASDDLDASIAAESRRARVTARWRRGAPWVDGDGGTFADRYDFAETPDYSVFEVEADLARDGGDVVAGWERARDLLFPYLLMDERENDLLRISGEWRGVRLYLNHNDHMMDNALRAGRAMTDMRTDAENLMAGAVGDGWEIFVRRWDADNRIVPVANPAMAIDNPMLPDVRRVRGTLRRAWTVAGLDVAARLGLAGTWAGDENAAAYAALTPDADRTLWHVPFGLAADRDIDLGGSHLGLGAELAADAPSPEQLFIQVDKPGTMPTWVGNPELDDPVRATLRADWSLGALRAELQATAVRNYPYLAKVVADGQAYQTYAGVDARLLGASLAWGCAWADAAVHWNRGELAHGAGPMAEIRPLTATVEARTPEVSGFRARALLEISAEQDRVDASLGETSTPGWERLDLGLDGRRGAWRLALDVENVLDAAYARHLSYLRSPFAAGARVYDPGRTVRLTATYGI